MVFKTTVHDGDGQSRHSNHNHTCHHPQQQQQQHLPTLDMKTDRAAMNLRTFLCISVLLLQQEVSGFLQPLHSSSSYWSVSDSLPNHVLLHRRETLSFDPQHHRPRNALLVGRDRRKSRFVKDLLPSSDDDGPRKTVSARHATETSSTYEDLFPTRFESIQRRIQTLGRTTVYPLVQMWNDQFTSWQTTTWKFVQESWWLCPMVLAFVPIYTAVIQGKCACMPDWWQVVRMDSIRQSKDATFIISGFLISNIAYFASGAYLLGRFPVLWIKKRRSLFPLVKPTSFSMLGIWILLAGTVSTIFHSVQALGSHTISESLCYVDHAVAISAAFYFVKRCGVPSWRVWTIGIISLLALAISHPSYAAIHSLWHFLSAATATQWALEGYQRALNQRSARLSLE